MIKRLLLYIEFFVILLLSNPLPAKAAEAAAGSDKTRFLHYIFILLAILMVLLLWEIMEWLLKRKAQKAESSLQDVVSVVDEEPEQEDTFRALLREGRDQTFRNSEDSSEKESEDKKMQEESESIVRFSKEEIPEAEPEEKKIRRIVQVDSTEENEVSEKLHVEQDGNSHEKDSQESSESSDEGAKWRDLMKKAGDDETAVEQQQEKRHKAKVKLSVATEESSESGWRDLMQKAAQDGTDDTIPVVQKKADEKKSIKQDQDLQASVKKTEAAQEEEDPWKALLKKSKNESESDKEEVKPKSVSLKNVALADEDQETHVKDGVQQAVSVEIEKSSEKDDKNNIKENQPEAGSLIQAVDEIDIDNIAEEKAEILNKDTAELPKKRTISLVGEKRQTASAQASKRTIKAIDIGDFKKKEESTEEKKSSSTDETSS